MQRIALGLAYDGSGWRGWQTQPGGTGVQDALEAALQQFLGHECPTICAGRTDTGVHALSQVVHLETPKHRELQSWVRGLNALLPDSVAVQWAQPVSADFHARYGARSRTYLYVVRQAAVRSPLLRERTGWVFQPLNLEAMQQAVLALPGQHDFSSFRSSQCQAASPVRTMTAASVTQQGVFYVFRFTANAFLHHMVRNLVGALLYIGMGRQAAQWMAELLLQRDRRLAAPTFSPSGLYLAGVDYDPVHGLPTGNIEATWAQHLPWFS
ncbi:tRNA pseudouridine(38-40) synthase TruA [Pusillimonas sp. CC-YST705]|uniref:tRNA pseudouridine synthase A n=1 Tax=Mesopusillimonas faecipullorum TaxID=2755040 RepID=A0ABS8CAE3_9BURK|nr:tRNA pseudouridine(38-40) synthase TruA [Mesopusillimonas faecipullorum]MCB5363003.1 tRNA pseudouridine(38-40) synthase TruA [Mesopusillimonas faecipullorum]